jgi:succinate-acetate transporter protein
MAHEHSFANPGPVGLGALAMACFTFFALLTGRLEHNAYPILAAWLVGGFVCQFTTGVIELKDHNIVGGNVFVFFAAFFMLTTAIRIATAYGLHEAGLHFDARVNGWGWLAGAAFLIICTPNYLKSPKILFVAVVLIDIALLCLVALDLRLAVNRAVMAKTCAWCLFISGWIAIYLVGAITMNTHFGKVILPTTSPIIK